ncbi:peptidoglycan DD-metalloendopeptidase family protein [Marinobacter sp. 1-4A]|uniref:peptidoglycan DD-metalloendopeptidase family protein n=1 Tax=Marinobacter sp. 1-4A TaxID=2582919 RepID=UPI00190368CE|nr:peptidoglycan DD-metalloendopeptidase family protein [Marinobacter sp. 1-4A]MBK1853181.1 peptidoglycan DD-metalloendopeptidase family protein [Marinobacter sp. 1-4A]
MKSDNIMNIILVGKSHGKSRVLALNALTVAACCFVLVALVAAASWAGYSAAIGQTKDHEEPTDSELVAHWQNELGKQKAELASVQQNVQDQVDALTLRLGQIQGRLLRLDALGQRFVESGLVASDEFDFNQPAAVGGPEDSLPADSFSAPELTRMIDELERKMLDREQQLRLLDQVSSRQKLEDELYLEGRPITWGWLSSRYGYRSDPFTGKRTWHAGVDLAGNEGSDIISVAGGVVTYASERNGYGNLVEVDHGDGLVTRYAHCKTIKVQVGDVIQKGQVLALMGSTGRSTGPHVHFEVIRNGKSENPETYIKRASR